MSERKPRIVVDMDEVIADPISKFISLYQRDFGIEIPATLEPGKEIYHMVPAHINMKWHEYINEPGFFRDLPVITGSQETLKALQDKFDVYIVSAAMEFPNSLIDKYHWLKDHFNFISWKNIIFCGDKIVDAEIMIDDRIKNFSSFKGRKLLFTSPHNLLITEYERVNSWEEIAEKLL